MGQTTNAPLKAAGPIKKNQRVVALPGMGFKDVYGDDTSRENDVLAMYGIAPHAFRPGQLIAREELVKLHTWAELLAVFESFTCDGSCNNGSDVCAHEFWWACPGPGCGLPENAVGEDIAAHSDISGGLCMACMFETGKVEPGKGDTQ